MLLVNLSQCLTFTVRVVYEFVALKARADSSVDVPLTSLLAVRTRDVHVWRRALWTYSLSSS